MLRRLICTSVLGAVIVLLSGCGGSSNGGGGCATPASCPCTNCGGNSTTVTYTFSGSTATAVATKIGSGAWTQASLESNTLSLSIPNGTTDYSVAYVCQQFDERIYLASTLDGTSIPVSCLGISGSTGLATVQVNASAIPNAYWILIYGIESQIFAEQTTAGTQSLSGQLAAGTSDVAVMIQDRNSNVLAVKILRSQTIPGALNGGNAVVFTTSDETVETAASFANIPAGFYVPGTLVNFISKGGLRLGISDWVGGTSTYLSMPSNAFQTGDVQLLNPEAIDSNSIYHSVSLENYATSGGPQTFTFPAQWTYAGPTAAALPTFDYTYAGYSGLSQVTPDAVLTYTDSKSNSTDLIVVVATENYQGGATSLEIPDLSALTGFPAAPASGESVNWNADIEAGGNGIASPYTGDVPEVSNGGKYTVP